MLEGDGVTLTRRRWFRQRRERCGFYTTRWVHAADESAALSAAAALVRAELRETAGVDVSEDALTITPVKIVELSSFDHAGGGFTFFPSP
jgi:hypothetical protein